MEAAVSNRSLDVPTFVSSAALKELSVLLYHAYPVALVACTSLIANALPFITDAVVAKVLNVGAVNTVSVTSSEIRLHTL